MTIETSLRIELDGRPHILLVKMIRIEGVSYFFIRDKDQQATLLGNKVLELTYSNDFSLTEFAGVVRTPEISPVIVGAIRDELLKNQLLWS